MSPAPVWLAAVVVGVVFAVAFFVLGAYLLAAAYVLIAIFALHRFTKEPF